jgi:hypothetical protein
VNVDEAREHYYTHSGLASSAARQLAFAGIAIVWILATQDIVVVTVAAGELRAPLLWFVIALALDLLQYYWLAAFFGVFSRLKEKRGEYEFNGVPSWGNRVGITCFVAKGIAVAIGYFLLAAILWPVLFNAAPTGVGN